jgi:hypothetical protein
MRRTLLLKCVILRLHAQVMCFTNTVIQRQGRVSWLELRGHSISSFIHNKHGSPTLRFFSFHLHDYFREDTTLFVINWKGITASMHVTSDSYYTANIWKMNDWYDLYKAHYGCMWKVFETLYQLTHVFVFLFCWNANCKLVFDKLYFSFHCIPQNYGVTYWPIKIFGIVSTQ